MKSTLIAALAALFLLSCEILEDVSLIEDPYPVEFKEGKLYPSDYSSHKSFGSHIDIWHNYALIGCKKENGAYLFEHDGSKWRELKKLELRANYGIGDICFKEGWAAIGTEYANGSGKVEVYRVMNSRIDFVQEIHSNVMEDRFGSAVDISGDYMIIGAKAPWNDCRDCGTTKIPGRVYIYKLNGDQWILETEFDADPARENDGFGREVAISDHYAFVKGGYSDSVYVYSNLEGNWQPHGFLCPEPALVHEKEVNQKFGDHLEVNGETLVVGAPDYPVDGSKNSLGAVYIYTLQADNTWTLQSKIMNPNFVPDAEVNKFGSVVRMEKDYMIIGGDTEFIGGALVYKYSGAEWLNTEYIAPPDDVVNHGFGVAMDISPNWTLIGHSGDMDTGKEAGAVYIFENNN